MTDTSTAAQPWPILPPSYIRLYAATGGSEAGRLALEYAKSMLRIAPVRVIPCDGPGIWPGFEALLMTKAVGSYVNVVACGPDAWTRSHRIMMPRRSDPVIGCPVSSSWDVLQFARPSEVREIPKPPPEVMIERTDFWTAGVRNVLFAASAPRDQWQLAAAKKFDVIVVPGNHARYYWAKALADPHRIVSIEPPIADTGHAAVRSAVLGIPPSLPVTP